ncbi:MAG TPA: response regulator, partial [Candidatus Binatia bacterium]|nr:response regulator [Candidatus Binatia bacterium]
MSDADSVVFVVDDDTSIREALTSLLRSVGLTVEAFGSAREFRSRRPRDAPSCLVLDVRLPGASGLDLQRELVDAGEHIPIIFITGHGDIRMSVRAMKAGAVEFLAKPFRDQDLLDAIRQAFERDRAARQQRAELTEIQRRYDNLSSREREVLSLVAGGLLNNQAAAELGVSEITIKVHRRHIMKKM